MTPGGAHGEGRQKAKPQNSGDEGYTSKDLEAQIKSTDKLGGGTKNEDEKVDFEWSNDGLALEKQKKISRLSAARNVDYNEQHNSDGGVFDAREENDDDTLWALDT